CLDIDGHAWLDEVTPHQGRPQAEQFARTLGAAQAARIRRAGEAEPGKQAAEAFRHAAIFGADGHAQVAFGEIVALRRIGVRAEQRIVARVLNADLVRLPAALLHQPLDDVRARLTFEIRVGPRESDLAQAHPAVVIAGDHLQRVGTLRAARAGDAD